VEKVAVIEIKTTCVKLQLVDIIRNKYFQTSKVMEMPINLTKDFYSDMFIKPSVTKEINNILLIYKKIIELNECVNTYCLVSDIVFEAKNQNGFLNELYVNSGFKFKVADSEEEMDNVYAAVINSFNRPKGVIINISDFNSQIVVYNRRNVLNKVVIPYGSVRIHDEFSSLSFDEKLEKISSIVNKIIEESNIKNELPEEYDIIGTGDLFKNYGVICRKAKKYPLELAHNFVSSKDDLGKVTGLIKNIDSKSSTKIKGISIQDSKYFASGLLLASAILNNFDKNEFVISKLGGVEGILFHEIIPLTIEKPISDTLGYSLQMVNDYFDRKPNNSAHIYDLSMILFKQLKVLHKLGRSYVKVLRIASYLINSGYRIDVDNAERVVYNIILNSELFGVTHNEIIMAAFVALGKNPDNFALNEWVRFKEYLSEEDLIAVKKLSVILKVAESLDVTGFGNVTDISCDILGDSVIMKTIISSDASFEINNAMLCSVDFKKVFAKNLEVL